MIERISVTYDGVTGPTDPGPNAAIGFVVTVNDETYAQESKFQTGPNINEVTAEYLALIAALQFLIHKNKQMGHVRFYGDSPVIVNQLNGVWEVKPEHAIWNIQARNLALKFKDIGFNLLTRKQTKPARELAEKQFADRDLEYCELHYARKKAAQP